MTTTPTSNPPGFSPSTIPSHLLRSASKEASHILPFITPSSRILDVGCGPGSITRDLAILAPRGQTTGIDASPTAISAAQSLNVPNLSFQVANLFALPFPDESFDIVHANAVLIHQSDPVAALREMRRVCRSGGRIACRETDWGSRVTFPLSAGLSDFGECMRAFQELRGGEPDAGRRLGRWAIGAGFGGTGISVDCDAESWFGAEAVARMVEEWTRRLNGEEAVAMRRALGVSDERLMEWKDALVEWGMADGAMMAVMHMRMVAVK